MPDPAVSVLMPCHNSSRWLAAAIESVLGQSLREFELILIDNGSSDNTLEIAKAYAATDRRLTVIAQSDAGPAVARNNGRKLALGQWIATLDSDDIALPSRLEKQLALAILHPELVLIGSGFVEIDENGGDIATYDYPQSHAALLKHLERLRGFMPHSSAFYRRELADRLGGYRPRVGYAEDWDLWLRLAEQGRIASLAEALVKIRRHGKQMSHDGGGRPQLVHAHAATVAHFLRQAGEPDPIAATDEAETRGFLDWIEERMGETGVFERRRLWVEARNRAFAGPSRGRGLLGFAGDVLKSGYAGPLLAEKFSGSGLPRRLAAEWAGRRQA